MIERNPKATHLAKYRGRRDHGMSPYMSSGMGKKKRERKAKKERVKGREGLVKQSFLEEELCWSV